MRKHLYDLVDNKSTQKYSVAYAALMLVAIVASIIPLMFRNECTYFRHLEIFGCSIFIFDYIAKWATADFRIGKKGIKTFLIYPFSAWAIFDLITILPSFNILNRSLVSINLSFG